jgi:hypothetical protein
MICGDPSVVPAANTIDPLGEARYRFEYPLKFDHPVHVTWFRTDGKPSLYPFGSGIKLSVYGVITRFVISGVAIPTMFITFETCTYDTYAFPDMCKFLFEVPEDGDGSGPPILSSFIKTENCPLCAVNRILASVYGLIVPG